MSSEFPKVAVLLAAYNGMEWIEQQLVSICAQDYVSVSVYISVDPSVDGTEAWCAEFARTNRNVHLLPQAGPYSGAARNFFRLIRDVDLSGYDYVSFADQDDIWYLDKLRRAVDTLHSGSYEGYSSNVIAFWSNGHRMLVDKAQPQVEWDYLFEAAGPGCTYVLKTELATAFKSLIVSEWEKVQEVALHDWFCYAFARSQGLRWFIDPVPGMDYRQHASNQVGVNSGFVSAITRLNRIMDGWWFTQIRLIASLLKITKPSIVKDCEVNRFWTVVKFTLAISKCRRRVRDRLALLVVCLFRGGK